ncbi:MAG: hypothetical protein KJ956_08230 [Actinobacteria bacterium]|nr:hypothetical protein [Actinomycetota bacterium]
MEQVLPDPTGIGRVCMYGQPRLGSDAFVRFMRMLSALALLVAIGGAVILTLQVNEEPQPPQVEFVSGYGPGLVLLESATSTGPDPFTAPVAVDLVIDQALLAYPPLRSDALETPHRLGSRADLLVAGEFGWELVARRDIGGGRLPIDEIHSLAADLLGLDATIADVEDRNGDGFDDDGSFTLRAGDGSAVCVTLGSSRTLTKAQGRQIDVEDSAAANGLVWDPNGPCGTRTAPAEINRVKTGATPGVFGAARSGEVCDIGLLVSSLQSNPRAAEGWATVHGIPAGSISDYVSGLTPVVLLLDTAVTNFGWRNGEILPRQSVLQRGTSVLVDRRGRPVARCQSGSPLRPPQPLPATPAFQGDPWPGFSSALIDEIAAADHDVIEFVLVDIVTGEAIRRTPGIPGAQASLAGPIYVVEG